MPEEQLEGDELEGTHTPAPEGNVEVETLRAELVRLQARLNDHEAAARARRQRGRRWAVGLLIVLGCILLGAANVTLWLRSVVLSSNTWTATVGPLSQNETVARALSAYVVEGLFDAVEVKQAVEETLPTEYRFLSGSLARVLQDLAQETTISLIQSDQFNAVWIAANRAAHREIIGVLRGNGDLVYLRAGQLTLDLSDAFDVVVGSLDLRDQEVLADIQTRFVILESQQVAALQQSLAVLDAVGLLLPLLALASLFLAWLVSLWRRRTLLWIGVGAVVTMLVSLLAFALARPAVLVSIADPLVRLLAGEIWGVVVRGLFIQTILILVVGLLIAAGAALAGPRPWGRFGTGFTVAGPATATPSSQKE